MKENLKVNDRVIYIDNDQIYYNLTIKSIDTDKIVLSTSHDDIIVPFNIHNYVMFIDNPYNRSVAAILQKTFEDKNNILLLFDLNQIDFTPEKKEQKK